MKKIFFILVLLGIAIVLWGVSVNSDLRKEIAQVEEQWAKVSGHLAQLSSSLDQSLPEADLSQALREFANFKEKDNFVEFDETWKEQLLATYPEALSSLMSKEGDQAAKQSLQNLNQLKIEVHRLNKLVEEYNHKTESFPQKWLVHLSGPSRIRALELPASSEQIPVQEFGL